MDHSALSTLYTCPRKYELSYVRRIAEDKQASKALSFGTAWHKICEHHGRLGVKAYHPDLVEHVLRELQWVDPVDDYRTGDKLSAGYARWYEQHGRRYEWLSVEGGFYQDVAGAMERLEGRIDAVVKTDVNHGKGEELWVLDYKTTGRLESDWVQHYGISNQFPLYYVHARTAYPVAGVLVDLYHATKGNKSGKTEGEREGNRFYQLPLRFDPEQVEQAQQEYREALLLKQHYEARGVFPRNTSACRSYGRTCGFIDICGTYDPEVREQMIASYPPNTFDPHGE